MQMDDQNLRARLQKHVEFLAAAPRVPGTVEHAQARDHIAGALQQAGFKTRVESAREAGQACLNVLTDPTPGDEDLPLVVIGAHYDSVPDSPGADDNASAVAALLELAAWLGPRLKTCGSCQARIPLAGYDLEEYGLLGSARHSRLLRQAGTDLRGMISLEMLGFTDLRPGSQMMPVALRGMYPDVGDFIGVVGNEASAELLHIVTSGLKSVPGLPVELIAVPGDGRLLGETRLSDHSSFWDQGFHALMITDTSFFRNPHYHKFSDTPDTLDFDFLARVTTGVCAAAWNLLGASGNADMRRLF
ncbi:MAG: M28 family peptidase [Planctomycetes bacterium]|nr:M28 family peptidase [Planctomycetota bacterium]